ncbi:type II toxin-antitoxin system PemK/MazF family toxin [Halotia branconii]|uniref:Type II toxin-antitoxin system PemK/MazF family toxin n=1 Tax=Halotia branconii CENA392 TaxID=1539056 RepID=A0AAJ6P9C6_9CYAN|nr:type II toxin-antitoxin system PemK/MazF family toxin [Halotia branconii]WGV25605.1 type II toxin-antitoxin system PemK/MazF family toxin [Halotia branconii CENA392]
MNSPLRGEVWLVDLGYVAKVRPCLIISVPILDQDRALFTLILHTTSPRGSRFEVQVKVNFLQ